MNSLFFEDASFFVSAVHGFVCPVPCVPLTIQRQSVSDDKKCQFYEIPTWFCISFWVASCGLKISKWN